MREIVHCAEKIESTYARTCLAAGELDLDVIFLFAECFRRDSNGVAHEKNGFLVADAERQLQLQPTLGRAQQAC